MTDSGQSRSALTALRKLVFGCRTQSAFAPIAGVSQPMISRVERGGDIPTSMQRRIRAAATERGLPWDDRWFFEAVTPAEIGAMGSHAASVARAPAAPKETADRLVESGGVA